MKKQNKVKVGQIRNDGTYIYKVDGKKKINGKIQFSILFIGEIYESNDKPSYMWDEKELINDKVLTKLEELFYDLE